MDRDLKYQVIRSRRRTVAIQIKPDGAIVVRAPERLPEKEIHKFVESKREWICKHLERLQSDPEYADEPEMLTAEDIRRLADEASKVIPERVKIYAPTVGVTYGRITIRNQRTRWGSCSSKGNLNFNCLLMLTPLEVIDSVVVHELCHRKEMNHSKRFYEEVYRVYPEYDKWHAWLREHGQAIMRRM